MHLRTFLAFAAGLLIAAFAPVPHARAGLVTIDTSGSVCFDLTVGCSGDRGGFGGWGTDIASDGTVAHITAGQSIVAPSGAKRLTGFSIYAWSGNPFDYKAYVYAWNASTNTPIGPALYSSPLETHVSGAQEFVPLSFSTKIKITSGSEYILFLSTLGPGQGGGTILAFVPGSAYPVGDLFFSKADTFGGLFSTPWMTTNGGGPPYNLGFTADFSAVPEPSPIFLIVSGLLGLGFLRLQSRYSAGRLKSSNSSAG